LKSTFSIDCVSQRAYQDEQSCDHFAKSNNGSICSRDYIIGTSPHLNSRLKVKDTMPFVKISSEVPQECPPIQAGHTISWHFAVFEDLMTEKSTMLSTSFFTGIESGIAVGYAQNTGSKWLLREVLREKCFLGEKSISKWR
jgi:hypothetical protein